MISRLFVVSALISLTIAGCSTEKEGTFGRGGTPADPPKSVEGGGSDTSDTASDTGDTGDTSAARPQG